MKLRFTDQSKTGPEKYCPVLARPLMGVVRACKKIKDAVEDDRRRKDNLEIWNALRADDTDRVALLLTLSKQRREYLAGLLEKSVSDRSLDRIKGQALDSIRLFVTRDGNDPLDFVPALVRILDKPWRGNLMQPKTELLVEELVLDPKNGENALAAIANALKTAADAAMVEHCISVLRMAAKNGKDVSIAFPFVYEKFGLLDYPQKIEVLDFLNEAMKTDGCAAKGSELFAQILDREFAGIHAQYEPGWITFIREASQLAVNSKNKDVATCLVADIQKFVNSKRFMGETNRNSPEFTEAIVALAGILDKLKNIDYIWRFRRPVGIE